MAQRKAIGLVAAMLTLCLAVMAPAASAFPLPGVASDSGCTALADAPLPGFLDAYSLSLCPAAGGYSAIATSVYGITLGAAVTQDALHGNLTLLLRQGVSHGGLGNELMLSLQCGHLGPPCTVTAASSASDLNPLAVLTLDASKPVVDVPVLGIHLPGHPDIRRVAHRRAHRHARARR